MKLSSNKALILAISALAAVAIADTAVEISLPKPQPPNCPKDMVFFENGGFCMDRYEFPNKKGEKPLTGINFSEALKLCQARKKRLPTPAEFKKACSGEANESYPYGNEYRKGACADNMKWSNGPVPAGSRETCNRNGVYDLTGNAWEWVQNAKNSGKVAGGSWNMPASEASCGGLLKLANLVTSPSAGFRCASEPLGHEKPKNGKKKRGKQP